MTALPALVELAAAEGPVGQTARQSLEAIYGPKIDEQIFAALRAEKDPVRRAAWIGVLQVAPTRRGRALAARRGHRAGPVVATRALAALAKLAAPKDIPALVAIVLKTQGGPVHEEAERAVQHGRLQIADAAKRAQPVLAIYRAADPADRLTLLALLGRIGGDEVRPLIQAALDSKDPAIYEAGVRAISNWPNAERRRPIAPPGRDGQGRGASPMGPARIRAGRLRSPAAQPTPRNWRSSSRPCGCRQTDDQRLWVIQRAEAVRAVETLRFLVPYMDQPVFAERACRSVVELAHHKELRDPNRQEFAAALQKVLATAKDAVVLELAKRYLDAK